MTSALDLSTLERLGQGRAAEVFALDDNRVIKVMRDLGGSAIEREAAALRAAHAAGVPVPVPHERIEVAGRPALIMGRVRGQDMLRLFGSRPWTILGAGAQLARVHALLHEVSAPPELPTAKQLLAARLETSEHIPAGLRDPLLAELEALPDGDRLCHLDYGPSNVIVANGELVIIDWPGAARGDPLCDLACTALALEVGKEPPGTPWIIRLLAPIGRAILRARYLRTYSRLRPVDAHLYAGWRRMAAAQRLTYGLATETPALLRSLGG